MYFSVFFKVQKIKSFKKRRSSQGQFGMTLKKSCRTKWDISSSIERGKSPHFELTPFNGGDPSLRSGWQRGQGTEYFLCHSGKRTFFFVSFRTKWGISAVFVFGWSSRRWKALLEL